MSARAARTRARIRNSLPAPVLERASLILARALEARVRRSDAVRGAAVVLHAVGSEPGDPGLEVDPPVATRWLDDAVGYLNRRYRLVLAGELPDAARARRPGEPIPLALTFDDDLPSHVAHAAPVLARHGVAASAFLCGARSAFWWQLLQIAIDRRAVAPADLTPVPPHLVEGALRRRRGAIGRLAKAIEDLDPGERDGVAAALRRAVPAPPDVLDADGRARLAAAGWEICFHTRRHDLLTRLDERSLRDAVATGWQDVTAAFPRALAYPHGKATEREAAAARTAGYVVAFTGRAEVFTERTDVHMIGRLQPEPRLGAFALRLARALVGG